MINGSIKGTFLYRVSLSQFVLEHSHWRRAFAVIHIIFGIHSLKIQLLRGFYTIFIMTIHFIDIYDLNVFRLNFPQTLVMGDDLSISFSGTETRQCRQIQSFILHPEFNRQTFENDIAVIRVCKRISMLFWN